MSDHFGTLCIKGLEYSLRLLSFFLALDSNYVNQNSDVTYYWKILSLFKYQTVSNRLGISLLLGDEREHCGNDGNKSTFPIIFICGNNGNESNDEKNLFVFFCC